MSNKKPSYTKSGPGRRHRQGKATEQRGKGFRGVTFAPTRHPSIYSPEVRMRLRMLQAAGDWQGADSTRSDVT